MTGIDLDHLKSWIGTEEEASDIVTPQLVQRFEATIADGLAPMEGVPLGLHWCLAPSAAATGSLGEDGHPMKGGFLPPVPLPRRMWAGGELNFLDCPIEVGDAVTRRSRIASVAQKSGKAGELVFVTVQHEIGTDRGPAISERQDIVYREAAAGPAPQPPAPAIRPAEASEELLASTVLLSRYSALTFNGHRIHYDRDYAQNAEHYPGLVVHGPLQVTLLMNFAARLSPRPEVAQGRVSWRFSVDGRAFHHQCRERRNRANPMERRSIRPDGHDGDRRIRVRLRRTTGHRIRTMPGRPAVWFAQIPAGFSTSRPISFRSE